jgi:hypothetical protein
MMAVTVGPAGGTNTVACVTDESADGAIGF